MSYTYLQEQGEESSADNFSAIPAYVLSRLNLTAAASCSNGSGTDACRGSQSGTTFAHSTGDRGEDLLTLCAADSHARTFQQPDEAKASLASGRASGEKWPASLAKYDHDTCSWRTAQYLLAGDLELFSATWPRWGLMRDGECWERTMPVLPTFGSGSGFWRSPAARESGVSVGRLETRTGEPVGSSCRHYDKTTGRMAQIGLSQQVKAMQQVTWPTPQSSDNRPRATEKSTARRRMLGKQISLEAQVKWPTAKATDGSKGTRTVEGAAKELARGRNKDLGMMVASETGGALNPPWVEWLMGFPIGWTDLQPLETGRYQAWRHSHGERLSAKFEVRP